MKVLGGGRRLTKTENTESRRSLSCPVECHQLRETYYVVRPAFMDRAGDRRSGFDNEVVPKRLIGTSPPDAGEQIYSTQRLQLVNYMILCLLCLGDRLLRSLLWLRYRYSFL